MKGLGLKINSLLKSSRCHNYGSNNLKETVLNVEKTISMPFHISFFNEVLCAKLCN